MRSASSDGAQEMIPDNASDRHRNRLRFRRGEDGADIFQPEFQLKSGGLVFLIGDQSAIGPVNRVANSVSVMISRKRRGSISTCA